MFDILNSLYFKFAYYVSRLPLLLAKNKVDLEKITAGKENGGTFSEVYAATQTLSQDIYTTLMMIGGFGGVLMLIIAFIFFGIAGSGGRKDEAKSKIAVVLIAVAGIFAAVFLVGLFQKIGEALSDTGGTTPVVTN